MSPALSEKLVSAVRVEQFMVDTRCYLVFFDYRLIEIFVRSFSISCELAAMVCVYEMCADVC